MAECGHNDLHYLRGGRRGEQRGIFCRLCGATWRRTRIYGRGFTSHLLLVDEVQHDGVLDPCAARESHNLAAQPAQESQHGNATEPCGCDCGCGVRVPACWATLLCPGCAREECPQPAQEV